MSRNLRSTKPTIVTLATAYDEQTGDTPAELILPETFDGVSDEELGSLIEQFTAAGLAIFNPADADAPVPTEAEMSTLREIAEGVTVLRAEQATRNDAAATRATEAAELAAGFSSEADGEGEGDGAEDGEGDEGAEDGDGDEPPAEGAEGEDGAGEGEGEGDGEGGDSVTASAARPSRINLRNVRSRQTAPRGPQSVPAGTPSGVRDLVTVAADSPLHAGAAADFGMVAEALNRRLASFPEAQYAQANASGRALKQQFGLMSVRKPFTDDMIITSEDPAHIESVLRHAMDESRLPGGSLVASGGWCAPSETIYDMCELESRDGLFSLPEVGISRGGLRWTTGPSFADIFNAVGFSYTEEQDISGDDYPKPCYKVECPDFEEERLNFDGLCIQAGLLQNRAYPELTARVLRGALIAHDHKMAAHYLTAIAAGSTTVQLPANQVGTTAPILTAIELQHEHYLDTHRMQRSTTLEAVFPFWVRGAIRADLSRRQGVELLDVTDAQIEAWFRLRGINPQFVYNYQSIGTTPASGFTSYPSTVEFLLYSAGTWVKGGADIITIDTMYDSTLLAENDFTALFSEEGWMVMKMCQDSRKVRVPICPDGATHIGVEIACNGATA